MDEPKRRSYAVDDVETISRRMKEIAAERELGRKAPDLYVEPNPLDGERSMAPSILDVIAMNNALLDRFAKAKNPKPDSLEFWQPLIDAGILEVGEA